MKSIAIVFNAMTFIFLCILIFWFTQLDYDNLGFNENRNVYFGMASVVLIIFALQMIKESISKKNNR